MFTDSQSIKGKEYYKYKYIRNIRIYNSNINPGLHTKFSLKVEIHFQNG